MVGVQEWRRSVRAVSPEEIEGGRAAEAALLRAGQAGDDGALAELLARQKRSLYALCYGILGHTDDVEDAVQETFLRALRGLASFRADAAFRTWLFRIAVNVCLKWKARHPPTEPWDLDEPSGSHATASPETIALRRLQMIEALQALRPRHRAILLLKEREGWNVAEIAAALGCNKKRVENELYQARCALADWRRRDAGEGNER